MNRLASKSPQQRIILYKICRFAQCARGPLRRHLAPRPPVYTEREAWEEEKDFVAPLSRSSMRWLARPMDTLCWYAPAGMPRWHICGNVAYFFQTVSYLFSFFFFSRIDWYKHVNMPQKIRNIRYIVVSCVAIENHFCHMISARYHTLERKNTDLSGVSACEAAVAIFLLILPQMERKTSWNLIFPPIITCPGASIRSRSLENSLCGKISA